MLGSHDRYIYNVTKPMQSVYNSYWSYPLTIISALYAVTGTIVAITYLATGGIFLGILFLFLSSIAITFLSYCSNYVYTTGNNSYLFNISRAYLDMTKEDQKKYEKIMDKIHNYDKRGVEKLNRDKVLVLFTSLSESNVDSFQATKKFVDDELKRLAKEAKERERWEKEQKKILDELS